MTIDATLDAPAAFKKPTGFFSKLFNRMSNMDGHKVGSALAGAGVTFAVKSTAATCAATFGAAPLLALAGTALAVGIASASVKHIFARAAAKKDPTLDQPKFWSKQTAKNFGMSFGMTMLGGITMMALAETLFGSCAEAATHKPSVLDVPTKPSAANALDSLHGNAKAQALIERAKLGKPQALKDLAYSLYNGKLGLGFDKNLALDLYHQAADVGNKQAIRDLKFLEGAGAHVKTAAKHAAKTAHAAVTEGLCKINVLNPEATKISLTCPSEAVKNGVIANGQALEVRDWKNGSLTKAFYRWTHDAPTRVSDFAKSIANNIRYDRVITAAQNRK
jgi:hypothetical protein